jgi:hypothetical protein
MVLAGAVSGAGALALSVLVTYGSGTVFVTCVVFSVFTIGPAVALWLTHSRLARAHAAGLLSTWGAAVFVVFVWHPWSTMSADEVERAKAEVAASGNPALYVGDEVAGHDLNSYYLGGDQANFFYGKCHPSGDDGEGGCTDWDITVHNSWGNATLVADAAGACTRLEPVLGVPAVRLYDELLGIDELVLFTGSTKIRLEFAETTKMEEKIAVMSELRSAANAEATSRLPSPVPGLLTLLEHDCGAPN